MPPEAPQEVSRETAANATRIAPVEITKEDVQTLHERRTAGAQTADLPPLSIDAMDYAKTNFTRMDGDGDGRISDHELDGYEKANAGKLSEKETKLLAELKGHRRDIANAGDDETGFENSGFSRFDIDESVRLSNVRTTVETALQEKNSADLRPALEHAKQNFKKIDGDGNSFVSEAELDKYMKDGNLSASEKQMMQQWKDKFAYSNLNQDGDGLGSTLGRSEKDLAKTHERINDLTFGVEHFTKMDADGNGFVSKEEITGYEKARNDLTDSEKGSIKRLKESVDTFQQYSNDEWGAENNGFSGHDLKQGLELWGSPGARQQRNFDAPVTAPAEAAAAEAETPATTAEKPAEEEAVEKEEPKAPEEGGAEEKEEKEGTEEGSSAEGTAEGENNAEETSAVKEEDRAEDRTHTIKRGDSLWKICRDELMQRNNGQRPSYGDIMRGIDAVTAANGMDRSQILQPGRTLKIPQDLSHAPASIAEGEPDPNSRNRVPRPTPAPEHPPVQKNPEEAKPASKPEVKAEPEKTDSQILRENWRRIDRSGDDRVSKEEIQEYVNNNLGRLKLNEIQALGRMAAKENKIQELVNDERGDENSGISRRDLDKAEEMKAASEYLLDKQWNNINRNGDRFISKDELTRALVYQDMPYMDRAMLAYLRDNYGKFQEGSNNEKGDENSGVTYHDLMYYANIFR